MELIRCHCRNDLPESAVRLAPNIKVVTVEYASRRQERVDAAGFKLDGESELLRNPADNKAASNSETGHFASDRFMLWMKHP